jgi:hypothetical protein
MRTQVEIDDRMLAEKTPGEIFEWVREQGLLEPYIVIKSPGLFHGYRIEGDLNPCFEP